MEGKQNPLFVKADMLAKEIYKVCRFFPAKRRGVQEILAYIIWFA